MSMQKIFTLLCMASLLVLSSFKPIKGLDEVISALNGGNASELTRFVDENVEIGLPGKTGTYSKAQSIMIFRDFFANNGVKSFEIKHKGDNNGRLFCVGLLHTKTGSFRTQIFMNNKNGRQVIKLISFQG